MKLIPLPLILPLVLASSAVTVTVNAQTAIAPAIESGWITFPAQTLKESGTAVRGDLKLPATSPSTERVPAVVIIHNSGGLQDRTGAGYVKVLNDAGIATLELDLFPRGNRPSTTRENLPHTFGSLVFLAAHPRIDPARIGIMGFSWGGILSLVSASTEVANAYVAAPPKFAAHLALYPVCSAQLGIVRGTSRSYPASTYQAMTGAPVLILAAEKDDYDKPDSCQQFVDALSETARAHISLTVYRGVGHGWDTQENRTYMDNAAREGRGGYVTHSRDDAVAKESQKTAVQFFTQSFGR